MRPFGKITLIAVLSLSLFILRSCYPAHALVIAAPIIAISVFKAAVFLVSLLSVPLTVLIRLIKKQGALKTIGISLLVLAVIFGLAFAFLAALSKNSYDRYGLYSRPAPGINAKENRDIVSFDRVVDPNNVSAPIMPYEAPAPYRSPLLRIMIYYLIGTSVLLVIMCIPLFLTLVIINNVRKQSISLKRMFAVSALVSLVVSIMCVFVAGLAALTFNNILTVYY